MTLNEIEYVLDRERECVQKRSNGKCNKECSSCSSRINAWEVLDTFDRIINRLSHETKKGY